MERITKRMAGPLVQKAGGQEGDVTAVFSTFGNIDSQGDVMMPGSIQNGQEVALVWAHDWGSYPVGKGTTVVSRDRAVFNGHFFLDTEAGMEAYKTVKNMAGLQEYSFGFSVRDAEFGQQDGVPVRFVKGVDLFEVSPVLIGANRQTGTLAIKSDTALCACPVCQPVGTTTDDKDAQTLMGATITWDGEGTVTYRDPPYNTDPETGEPFADEIERVLLAVEDVVARAADVTAMRAKAGRAISNARRRRLLALRDELSALLDETDPAKDDDADAEDDEGKGQAPEPISELEAIRQHFLGLDGLYDAVEHTRKEREKHNAIANIAR